MSVISDGNAVDGVIRVAFDDRAVAMYRTGAFVPNTGNGYACDRKVGCGDVYDFAAVAGRGVQPDDVRHWWPFILQSVALLDPRRRQPASIQLGLEVLCLDRSAFARSWPHQAQRAA